MAKTTDQAIDVAIHIMWYNLAPSNHYQKEDISYAVKSFYDDANNEFDMTNSIAAIAQHICNNQVYWDNNR